MASNSDAEARRPGHDLAQLRLAAMALIKKLDQSSTPLSARGGAIDGFAKLAAIVVRIIEQERRNLLSADLSAAPQVDEQALGLRITAELDRLAARTGAPGIRKPDLPQPW